MGDGQSLLVAIEDQDLNTPMTTRSTTDQDDLLPIGEMQVGLQWTPMCKESGIRICTWLSRGRYGAMRATPAVSTATWVSLASTSPWASIGRVATIQLQI